MVATFQAILHQQYFFVLFACTIRKSAALIISSAVIDDCTLQPTTFSPPKIKIWSQKWKKPVREFGSFRSTSVFLQPSNYDGEKRTAFLVQLVEGAFECIHLRGLQPLIRVTTGPRLTVTIWCPYTQLVEAGEPMWSSCLGKKEQITLSFIPLWSLAPLSVTHLTPLYQLPFHLLNTGVKLV